MNDPDPISDAVAQFLREQAEARALQDRQQRTAQILATGWANVLRGHVDEANKLLVKHKSTSRTLNLRWDILERIRAA